MSGLRAAQSRGPRACARAGIERRALSHGLTAHRRTRVNREGVYSLSGALTSMADWSLTTARNIEDHEAREGHEEESPQRHRGTELSIRRRWPAEPASHDRTDRSRASHCDAVESFVISLRSLRALRSTFLFSVPQCLCVSVVQFGSSFLSTTTGPRSIRRAAPACGPAAGARASPARSCIPARAASAR